MQYVWTTLLRSQESENTVSEKPQLWNAFLTMSVIPTPLHDVLERMGSRRVTAEKGCSILRKL